MPHFNQEILEEILNLSADSWLFTIAPKKTGKNEFKKNSCINI